MEQVSNTRTFVRGNTYYRLDNIKAHSKYDDRYINNDGVHELRADTPVLAEINSCVSHCRLHDEEPVC